MNDIELCLRDWRNRRVNGVCKISEQFQCTPPDEECDGADDSAPDENLRCYLENFIYGLHAAPILVSIPTATVFLQLL